MQVSFTAKTENIIFSRAVAMAFLLNLDLQLAILNEVKTVISEAVTNSIIHGYDSDETKSVDLKISYDEKEIQIEIIDEGVGIPDIEKAKKPMFSTKNNEERAGLGFTIMEAFTDKLDITSSDLGTKVKCIKKI
ncbi:anti-sigma F factor [Mycoplasmatota bacterium WC44]